MFREVLDRSGIFIDPADARSAAATIAGTLVQEDARTAAIDRAAANLRRWNGVAATDHDRVVEMLMRLVRPRHKTASQAWAEN